MMKRLRRLTAIITVWACVFGSLSLQGLREETSAMDTEFKNSVEATRDGSQINLTWAAKDNATAYEVMRSSGRYSEWTKVADVTDTSYSQEVDSVYKYYYKVVAKNGDATIETSNIAGMDITLWGDGVDIFSPSDDKDAVDARIKSISDQMMKASEAEWSDNRYALMFKPGNYSNISKINVGFYTQVLGLGATPNETVIPNINVDSAANGNVLINFWRGIENIKVDTGDLSKEVKWGASQAAPIRRLYVNGKLHLDDIGLPASGGFLADTYVTGQTGSWSQQQFYLRNNHMSQGWYDGVWNIMFQGCDNAPQPSEDWANTSYKGYTVENSTARVKEKPFVFMQNGEYKVFVPSLIKNAVGTSWSDSDMGEGRVLDIEDFYIAKPEIDNASTVQEALLQRKNIIFTPGVYRFEKPIEVDRPDTVVLGLGLATIICDNKSTAIKVSDRQDINIAGLVLEAGSVESQSLLEVGSNTNDANNSENPIVLSDVFTRVGGARVGKVKSTVVVNANDVIMDHLWLWRADHGAGANWNESTADNGIIVNGDRVDAYGLFVEHFQKYQTLWNGEDGHTYFYQCELPYDVPTQSDWMSDKKGYSGYKVAENVTNHSAEALGVYEVFVHTNEYITLANAIEMPATCSVHNACTVSLGNVNGEITHIVNGMGDSVGSGISPQGQKVGINDYPEKTVFTTDKKGLCSWYYAAGNNANQRNVGLFKNVGAGWFYNWGATDDVASEARAENLEYVPMTWGAGSVRDSEMNRLKQGHEDGLYDCLLTFNEPDLGDQANMTVDQAINLWPKLESTGLRLGSPAGAAVEDAWVEQFMAKAKEKGYRVDFLTLHVYQDFTHPSSVSSLKYALQRLYNKYQIPIWITEIGNVDVSTQWAGYSLYQPMSHEVARKYIKEACEMLETLDFVERYAWFVDYSNNIGGTAYTRLYNIEDDSLTPEGEEYALVQKSKEAPTTTQAPTTKQPTTKPVTTKQTTTKPVQTTTEPISINPVTEQTTTVEQSASTGQVIKKVVIKKVYRKKKSAKKLKLKIKKLSGVKGYQIAVYKTKKNAKKNKKALFKKYIKKNKATLLIKHKKLKNKKKLFVRVRGYIKEATGVVFGNWSSVKKVKIK